MLRNCKLYGPKCHAKFASFFAIGAINLAILRSIFTLPNTSLLYPFHRCGILKDSLALERVERLVLDNFDDEHGNVKKSTFSHSTDEVDSQRAAAATEVFMRWLLDSKLLLIPNSKPLLSSYNSDDFAQPTRHGKLDSVTKTSRLWHWTKTIGKVTPRETN